MPPNSNLELIYFPSRCRGNLPRSLMIDGGLQFTETRIAKGEEWPARKAEFIFGQMPVLKVDGTRQIAQSHAIARYIAKLTDPSLLGETTDEAANVDMWYYQTDDVFMQLVLPFYDKEYTVSKVEQLFSQDWSQWMAPFEQVLAEHDHMYLANNKLSLADYHLFDVSEFMAHFKPTLLDQTPGVKVHHGRLCARPGIAKFLDYVQGMPFTNSGNF